LLSRDDNHPNKGPIRNFNKYLKEIENKENKETAQTFESINRWINDDNLDNKLSNTF
jgi:hypothetical protein